MVRPSPYAVVIAVAFVLVFVACERVACAAGDREKAQRDFTEGVRLLQLGDFEGARALFLRADAEVHAPSISFNLARAEERLGDPQAAVEAYESYLREAGPSGELGLAASLAVAEIRDRSARVRVDSNPRGAIVEVDGRVARERTPMSMLVRPGRHRVKVTAPGIDETRLIDAERPGAEVSMLIELASAPVPVKEPTRDALPHEEGLLGLAGAAAALVPYHFMGPPKSPAATRFADHTNVTVGAALEAGIAVLPSLYLGVDVFGSLGTYGHPNYVVGGGIGVLYRLNVGVWLRAAATVAAVDSNKDSRVLSTDVVLGPSFEFGFELARTRRGAWLVSAGACLLPADAMRDNDALFFPVKLGFRAF